MSVKLKYFQKNTNVGDVFSRKVADAYISDEIENAGKDVLTSSNVLIIGSIIEWADNYSYICGAGLISSKAKLSYTPKKINCVRGPLTAYFLEKQGFSVSKCYGDPGLLISKFYKNKSNIFFKIGIIPHYVDKDSEWVAKCYEMPGIHVIDVLAPLDQFVNELQMCDIIYSSSLHGIIFAHSMGKLALWVDISDKLIGGGFKFYDYYLSIGVSPEYVKRVKVTRKTDPYALQTLAEGAKIKHMLSDIEAALVLTKEQLIC